MKVGENQEAKLKSLFEQIIKKYYFILNYYKNKAISDNINENEFINHSIIILLAIREMDIATNLLEGRDGSFIVIPQFNLELKKVYNMRFKFNPKDNNAIKLKDEIKQIYDDLKTYGASYKINNPFDESCIENLTTALGENNGKNSMLKIIISSHQSGFYKFWSNFANNEISSIKNYSQESLARLYMAKYVVQYLIFIKEWIQNSINKRVHEYGNIPLSKIEAKKYKKYTFDEAKIMTLPLFQETKICKYETIKNEKYLIQNNETELDDLIKLNLSILKKINEFQNNNNKI